MDERLVPPTSPFIVCQAVRASASCVDARDSRASTKSTALWKTEKTENRVGIHKSLHPQPRPAAAQSNTTVLLA